MIVGSIVALITPFNEDGSVNYSKLEELVRWHIDEGTDGILALGTTAETPSLTEDEEEQIAEMTIRLCREKIPVIVGSGSNCTDTAVKKSIKYEKMGADGLLVINPYYNKTNRAGLLKHFYAVADAVNTPVYIYNVPGRTGMSIPFDVFAELSKHRNIAGVKEASGDISLISKLSTLITDDFNIYSGNDDVNVPLMSLGGAGIISVLANILPAKAHEMAYSYWHGDPKKASELQRYYLDFINHLFIETNPIPVKEAMNLVGMNVGGYRMPLCPMDGANRQKLIESMKTINLL